MTYDQAVDHLYALAPELAPTVPGGPTRKFDLAHMRALMAALGNPQDRVPSILIAGTNGKGSTAATLASILTSAGYRAGLYTSPHLSRPNERIQLARPVLPGEYGNAQAHGADGPLTLTQISDADFAALYTQVDAACTRLTEAGALPVSPSFFERLTALAFLYFAGPAPTTESVILSEVDQFHQPTQSKVSDALSPAPTLPPFQPQTPAEILILEVGLGGRLDATNIVTPLFSIVTDIALDHQEYLGTTIAEIAREKCGILRENGTLITLSQHPQANQAIGEAAARLHVTGRNAADFLPPAQRNPDHPATNPRPLSPFAAGGASASPAPAPEADSLERKTYSSSATAHHSNISVELDQVHAEPHRAPSIPASSEWVGSSLLPRNRYTLSTPAGPLQVDSPLPGVHQQRNLALAITAAFELRNQYGYNIANAAIEAGIRNTRWPGRLEFIAPNLILDVAHNPAGAWTLRAALAALPPATPRTLVFSCLRDKDLEEMSRILFPLFDSTPAAHGGDPLRARDHILLAPIDSPRAADVQHLQAAAHALDIPAHAAPHLAAALHQAQIITPPDGLIFITGSVYLVGEARQLLLTLPTTGPTA